MRITDEALRDLCDCTTDCFILTDGAGVIRYANYAAATMFGVDRQGLPGMALVTFVSGDIQDRLHAMRSGGSGETPVIPVTLALAEGRNVEAILTKLEEETDDDPARFLLMIPSLQSRTAAAGDGDGRDAGVERFALLDEASRVFAEASLDLEAVMEAVSVSLATHIGDTCVIRLLSDDREWLHPVAVYHCNPESCKLARLVNGAFSHRADTGPAATVMGSCMPVLVAKVDQCELREKVHSAYLDYVDRVGVSSLVMAPLRVRGRVIGTLGLTRDNGRPAYTAEDATLTQELADRAALAVENARLYHGIERELAKRNEAEEKLRHAHDLLARRVEEQKSEVMELMHLMEETRTSQRRFVAGASHDLRTPLTIVQAELELLRLRPEHDPSTRESLDRIHAESKRLDRLASDLLLLASLDSLSIDESMEAFHLEELIIDCVSEMNYAAAAKNIAWNIQLDNAPAVTGVQQMIHRALLNLLDNAISYSVHGGIVGVALGAVAGSVTIEVEDEGAGIEPEDLPKVFERFYKSDVARSSAGSGLGLSIVKSVADAHNGEVTIESTAGKGTIVRLRLPA